MAIDTPKFVRLGGSGRAAEPGGSRSGSKSSKRLSGHPNDRSGRLERALGSERVYLGGVEAELRQDFVIVLTQMRSTSFESG